MSGNEKDYFLTQFNRVQQKYTKFIYYGLITI